MKDVYRHALKTITWRVVGTLDTVLISRWITGSWAYGFSIGGIELITKMMLYFTHERIWFNFRTRKNICDLKTVLLKKAEYPVRLIALEDGDYYNTGDEIGIEVIDFSSGNMRCANKTNNSIFELFYDKITWEFDGKWKVKK